MTSLVEVELLLGTGAAAPFFVREGEGLAMTMPALRAFTSFDYRYLAL